MTKEYYTFIENYTKEGPKYDKKGNYIYKFGAAYKAAEKKIRFAAVFDNEITDSFDIYFFIETIQNFTIKIKDERLFYYKSLFDKKTKRAWEFFEQNSSHIEIIFNDKIEKYYFPIQPANRFVSDVWKNQFLDECKRSSPSEKLTDFLSHVNMLIDQMDHMVCLRTGLYGISVNPSLLETFRLVYLLLAASINTIMF